MFESISVVVTWTLVVAVLFGRCVESDEYNCSQVNCPPLSKIDCPSDSYIRETQEFYTISTDDDLHIVEEVFINCCVTKKCACKLCHRPSCHNSSLVLMEKVKETDTPGKCCGSYECIFEPECEDVLSTDGLGWLVDCQRCECIAGQKICHRSCDEIRMPPSNCIGRNSKLYSNGQSWKEDECTQCECKKGEKKCQTSFCKPLSCERKIKLPGECCAICVTEPSSSTDPPTESTASPAPAPAPSQPPCLNAPVQDSSDSLYSVRTKIVEYVESSHETCILYGVIVALGIILFVFVGLYFYERSKQRSYRPVTSLDDNYNKIKIKNIDF